MKLYHVSTEHHGGRWLMRPRVPDSTMDGECRVTPRICVAPSVGQCLQGRQDEMNAMLDLDYTEDWHVYSCEATPYNPIAEVPDAIKTGELWILEPTCFTYDGKILVP